MSVLSTSRGPVPNVLHFLGDYGVLVIHAGNMWYVCTNTGWTDHHTNPQYIRLMKAAPPSNVGEGCWGIIPSSGAMAGAEHNWDGATVQAALDQWLDEHRNQFLPNTNSVRPLYFRARPTQTFKQMEAMIEKATAEVQASKVRALNGE